MAKFKGSLAQLVDAVAHTEIAGTWSQLNDSHHQYRTHAGGVLNWWRTTRTINFQGKPAAAKQLQSAVRRETDLPTEKENTDD